MLDQLPLWRPTIHGVGWQLSSERRALDARDATKQFLESLPIGHRNAALLAETERLDETGAVIPDQHKRFLIKDCLLFASRAQFRKTAR